AVEARGLHVVAEDVDQRVRLVHRLDAGQVEGVDLGEVVEHVTEVVRGRVELLGRQFESSEPGNLGDDVRREPFGHERRGYLRNRGRPTCPRAARATGEPPGGPWIGGAISVPPGRYVCHRRSASRQTR